MKALQTLRKASVEDEMPQKTKNGETRPNPVIAEALTPGTASGKAHRPVLSSNPAKRKATSGRKSRSSVRSVSLSAASHTAVSEDRAQVGSPGSPAVKESRPQGVQSASKGGAKKKTAASPGLSGRSSSVKARSTRRPVRATELAPQPEGSVGPHPEETSSAGVNGHFDHDEVARLAYSYWAARGYQGGSPEDDWYRAQTELRQRRQQPKEAQPRKRARKA